MRRDMDLVRQILLQVESADGPVTAGRLSCPGHTEQEVMWHIDLMAGHGLLDASVTRAWGGERVAATVDGLTWEGLDMLDAMRSARVWERAKAAIERSVGATTMDVAKAVCCKVATGMALAAIG